MAWVHNANDCARRAVNRPDLGHVRPQQDQIGFLARRKTARLMIEVGTTSALDRREFQYVPRGQQRRQILLAVALALQNQCTLQCHCRAHDRERILRHRRVDVRTETRAQTVVQRSLNPRHSMPHCHFDRRRQRNADPAISNDFPALVGQVIAMDQFVAVDLQHEVDIVFEPKLMYARRDVDAVTGVIANPVRRDAAQCVVRNLHALGDEAAACLDAGAGRGIRY